MLSRRPRLLTLRPTPLFAAAASAALAAFAPTAFAAPQNVVVIVMDDVGQGLIGACDVYAQAIGAPPSNPANTPAIDQLMAARGVTFTRAWSSPVCTPSRSTMLTGRHPRRTGMGSVLYDSGAGDNIGLDPHAALLPEILHAAPSVYHCAALGKWHLSDPLQLRNYVPCPLGQPAGRWFDQYAGAAFNFRRAAGVPQTETGYFHWDKLYASEIEVGFNPCAPDPVPCHVIRDAADPLQYATADTTEDALTLLGQLEEPFFLYVAYNAVHLPVHDVPVGLPTEGCGPYTPPPLPCDPGVPATKATLVRCMMESLDAQIARVLCRIDDSTTTVILVGDNGTSSQVVLPPYAPAHAKASVYEGGISVPLIVRSPRIDPSLEGTYCEALVGLIDIYATTCELAGVDPMTTPGVDSISLVPYLDGAGVSLRTLQYTEVFYPNFVPDPVSGGLPAGYIGIKHDQALRNARFKLIRKWRRSHATLLPILSEELYDMVAGGPSSGSSPGFPLPDFLEANNLLRPEALPLSPEAQAAYDMLRSELDVNYPSLVF